MFKTDTLLAVIQWLIKELFANAEKHADIAESHQAAITELEAARKEALAESDRANRIADKIAKLIA